MSLVSAFLKQTIYMGMPDDSVRNSALLFQLQKPPTLHTLPPQPAVDPQEWKPLSVGRRP